MCLQTPLALLKCFHDECGYSNHDHTPLSFLLRTGRDGTLAPAIVRGICNFKTGPKNPFLFPVKVMACVENENITY